MASVTFKVQTDPPIPDLLLEHVLVANGQEFAIDLPLPTNEDGALYYAVSYSPYPQYVRAKEGQEYTGRTETVDPTDGETYDLFLFIDCPYKRAVGGLDRTALCALWRRGLI